MNDETREPLPGDRGSLDITARLTNGAQNTHNASEAVDRAQPRAAACSSRW